MDDQVILGKDMLINPFGISTPDDARPLLKQIDGLQEIIDFCSVKKHLKFKPVIRYLLLLYSNDSILNVKPMRPLQERQLKAAALAGFEKTTKGEFHAQVKFILFELGSEDVFNFVFNYLIYQKNYIWAEICTLEQQLAENQRIRMRPVEADKDKDIMAAMEKKSNLTKHYKDLHKNLQDSLNDFYGDHEEVKVGFDIHKSGLAAIELYAQER